MLLFASLVASWLLLHFASACASPRADETYVYPVRVRGGIVYYYPALLGMFVNYSVYVEVGLLGFLAVVMRLRNITVKPPQ